MKKVKMICPRCDGHKMVFSMLVKDVRGCSLCKFVGMIDPETAKKWSDWAKRTRSLTHKKMDDLEVMFLLAQRKRKEVGISKVADVHPGVEKMQFSFKLAD